jgi:hypothetical protein
MWMMARRVSWRSPLARWALAFVALNLVDVVETSIGLRLGAHEATPLYSALLRVAPYALLIPLKLALAGSLVAYVLLTRHWWPAWVALAEMRLLAALMAFTALSNVVALAVQVR